MKIFRQRAWAITLLASLTALYLIRNTISATSTILLLPLRWHQSNTPPFLINADDDHFDITFANYSRDQITSEPDYPDLVPSILHHIQLGSGDSRPEWQTARQSCLKLHPGWQAYLWTDENAATFVQEKFPELWDTWCRYRFPIQRIDALRYMVLQHYGGVVLDLDLECTRSLGPLRRFGFVAPAAHPTGFSIGFMMAAKNHPFVWELVRNLPTFDKRWFGLPYPTVMFSTGCHYASSLHAKQRQRSDLRILAGTIENPDLHRLNGNVVTPLFHHLGTSSWHSFDAELIVKLGHAHIMHKLWYLGAVLVIVALLATWCRVRKTRKGTHSLLLQWDIR